MQASPSSTLMLAAPSPLRSMVQRGCGRLAQSPGTSLLSLTLLCAVLWIVWQFLAWAAFGAVIAPDAQACRASSGACWGVVVEKGALVMLGRFPQGEQWRPILGCALMLFALGAAAHPRFFGSKGLLLLVAGIASFGLLMAGGFFGLTTVSTELWGGLPLTLFLAVISCLLGVPAGIALALGRRSRLPALRWISTGYVELIRGVPLITLLFFGAFVLPLVLPPSWRFDAMLRIGVCLTMFSAAYLAEVFRGGLQAVVKGQYEAAHALGLTKWQSLNRVVLPQALRITIGPVANNFIGAVKDTSLVAIVNIYDMTGALKLAMSDPEWRPFFVEIYILVSSVYLVIGVGIAQYGRFLERRYALK